MHLTLFACFALAASGTQPDAGTGLQGEIRIAPAHGGPTRIGVINSKPLAHTTFLVRKKEKIIATFATDAQGRFRVSLPPGKCAISNRNGKGRLGRYAPFEVEIIAGQMKTVHWECDSGMN